MTPSNWKDQHSVTCPICGQLADEREAIPISADLEVIGPSLRLTDPRRAVAIQSAADEYGTGEAHPDCLTEYANHRFPVPDDSTQALLDILTLAHHAQAELETGELTELGHTLEEIADRAEAWRPANTEPV